MNGELLRLIRETGVDARVSWDDVVVVHNAAPVPCPPARAEGAGWNRGFNFVLLRDGIPAYFCKCRPADHPGLKREADVGRRLANVKSAPVSVPLARFASSNRLAVQVSDFLDGVPYNQIVGRQHERDFLHTVGDVLHGLSRSLNEAGIYERARGDTVDVVADVSVSLPDLRSRLSLPSTGWDALMAALDGAGSVPAIPQHGDLWVSNILIANGVPWVIDFDGFGDVRVPLYDDLTLIGSALDFRFGAEDGNRHALLRSEPLITECLDLLGARAEALGLTPRQLDGVLVYQLMHRAATVATRAGVDHAARHDRALASVAACLSAGRSGLLSRSRHSSDAMS